MTQVTELARCVSCCICEEPVQNTDRYTLRVHVRTGSHVYLCRPCGRAVAETADRTIGFMDDEYEEARRTQYEQKIEAVRQALDAGVEMWRCEMCSKSFDRTFTGAKRTCPGEGRDIYLCCATMGLIVPVGDGERDRQLWVWDMQKNG